MPFTKMAPVFPFELGASLTPCPPPPPAPLGNSKRLGLGLGQSCFLGRGVGLRGVCDRRVQFSATQIQSYSVKLICSIEMCNRGYDIETKLLKLSKAYLLA